MHRQSIRATLLIGGLVFLAIVLLQYLPPEAAALPIEQQPFQTTLLVPTTETTGTPPDAEPTATSALTATSTLTATPTITATLPAASAGSDRELPPPADATSVLTTTSTPTTTTPTRTTRPTPTTPAEADGLYLVARGNSVQEGAPGAVVDFDLMLINARKERVTLTLGIDDDVRCSSAIAGCVDALSRGSLTVNSGLSVSFTVSVVLPADASPGSEANTRLIVSTTAPRVGSVQLDLKTRVIDPAGTAADAPGSAPTAAPPSPTPAGSVEGTVMNLCTGEPAPNIEVRVGDRIIRTDRNGNYERVGLEPGNYIVALLLEASQGQPDHKPEVAWINNDRVVVHRSFRSPECLNVTFTPTAAPSSGGQAANTEPADAPGAADSDNVSSILDLIAWVILIMMGIIFAGGLILRRK